MNRWGSGIKIPGLSQFFACRSWWRLDNLADITATFEHVITLIEVSSTTTITCFDNLLAAEHLWQGKCFWHSEERASWYILIIKPTIYTNSQIYFWNRTLHVSDRFSVHHQECSTVHTAIHTGYADCLLASSQHNLHDIYLLLSTVLDSWWWRENLSETCRFLFQK